MIVAKLELGLRENSGLLAHGPKVPIPTEQMTVERCANGCAAAGWMTAGLERGQVRGIIISSTFCLTEIFKFIRNAVLIFCFI